MDAVNKLLDTVKLVCSLPSDLALADRIGVSRQLVSQWRKGANPIAEPKITALCKMAKLDAALWNAEIQAEQAAEPEVRSMYRDTWKRLSGTAALLMILVAPALSQRADAATGPAFDGHTVGIMRKGWFGQLLQWWLAWILRRPDSTDLEARICA